MLVLDEQRLERNRRGLAQEQVAHEINAWTMEQLGNARVIDSVRDSASNPERQTGKMYPNSTALEQALTTTSPNFVFEPIVDNAGKATGKKRLYWKLPDNTLDYLGAYEAGPTPEWSIMTAVWRWEPDPSYALGSRVLDRNESSAKPVSMQEAYDLLKALGPRGAKAELLRKRADNHDPDYRPGFIKVLETHREAIRGWRSVIVRPLQKGYITLAQAQAIVRRLGGTEERANWARATAQQSVASTI